MTDYKKPTLDGFRDHNTDDGEDWWYVGLYHGLEAILGELESWPKARVLNHSTGEISEGPLYVLIDRIAEGVKANHDIRIEPLDNRLHLGDYWEVVHGVMPPERGERGTLLIRDKSGTEKEISWPVNVPIPRYVRPVVNRTDDDWVDHWVVGEGFND